MGCGDGGKGGDSMLFSLMQLLSDPHTPTKTLTVIAAHCIRLLIEMKK